MTMPKKEPGKHRYIATMTYSMSQEMVDQAAKGVPVVLDPKNHVFGPLIGCWDCEEQYADIRMKPCLADGED